MFTDCIQGHARVRFNDHFIMNVHDNGAAAECLHGIAENITGRCLHDVLDKFRTIGIETLPLLGATDTFVGDALTTELIGPNLRFHICELSSRWESDKEHATPTGKSQSIIGSGVLELYGLHDSMVHIPPEFDDVRVRLPPCIDQWRKLLFSKPHIQRSHRF